VAAAFHWSSEFPAADVVIGLLLSQTKRQENISHFFFLGDFSWASSILGKYFCRGTQTAVEGSSRSGMRGFVETSAVAACS
jgi:hypothetical protein